MFCRIGKTFFLLTSRISLSAGVLSLMEERNPVPLEVERVLPAPFPPFSRTRRALLLSWPRKGAAGVGRSGIGISVTRKISRATIAVFPFLDLEKAAGHGRRRARRNIARYAVCTWPWSPPSSLSFSNVASPCWSTCDNSSIESINEKYILVESKKLIELFIHELLPLLVIGAFLCGNK